MSKEFKFFTYLLESYAQYKGITAAEALKVLDDHDLTDYIFNLYEMYHTESITNAFQNIDSLITTGRSAW